MVSNGQKLGILHVGNIFLNTGKHAVTLENVLVVPKIKTNLLSVSQLTSDLPYLFEFTANEFVLKSREIGKIITRGTRNGGLYSLQTDQKKAFYSNRFQAASTTTWYRRLGHPHHRIVQFLKNNDFISVC